jgi:hypothetical protein
MKTLLSLFFAVLLSLNLQAGEGFDKLFAKYSGDEEVTTINLTESMINIFSKFLGDEDQEARELLKSIESVKLITSEGKSKGAMAIDAQKVLASGYDELLRVNEGKETVKVMVKENGNLINDVIIFVDSIDEFVFINVTGQIDPAQVGKVLKTLDIKVDGLQELE